MKTLFVKRLMLITFEKKKRRAMARLVVEF